MNIPSAHLVIQEEYQRIYAIGDIHGCVKELETLLTHLVSKEKIGKADLIVFVGDYVDRGEASKEVIDSLIGFSKGAYRCIFLRGNHELFLIDFLKRVPRALNSFLQVGGVETLKSYGLLANAGDSDILTQFPEAHLDFLNSLERYSYGEKYLFAHAGIHPLKPLDQQEDEDIYWIRNEFIQNIHNIKKTVIFGHTPQKDIFLHEPYKIGIDTGVVFGNKLTCVELIERRSLQVKRGATKVLRGKF